MQNIHNISILRSRYINSTFVYCMDYFL